MYAAYKTTFTLVEWLSITGLAQCVLILVYMFFRVRSWAQATVPIVYFLILGLGFWAQLALNRVEIFEALQLLLWFSWSMSIPISYLLILQVSKYVKVPSLRHFWGVVMVFGAFYMAIFIREQTNICTAPGYCEAFFEWLYLLSAIVGSAVMLSLWMHKNLFNSLWQIKTKNGRDRYWLIIALVALNVLVLMAHFAWARGTLEPELVEVLRITFGIGFAYIVTTSLFRIYPAPVEFNTQASAKTLKLTADEKKLADKIYDLMALDKLYHEASFSRASLAQELQVSEAIISRLINTRFGKSFPQLINNYRVQDAKRMLLDSKIPVKTIAFEVGFNSLASFNRVFKEIEGTTPSKFRNDQS